MRVDWGGLFSKASSLRSPPPWRGGNGPGGCVTNICQPPRSSGGRASPLLRNGADGVFPVHRSAVLGRAAGQSQAGRALSPRGVGAGGAALGLRELRELRELRFPAPRPPAALGLNYKSQ